MRVIWSLGEARVDEIYAQIPQELVWSLATVKTLLGRLVKKEMLSTEKEGRKFVYRPLMEECTAINLMADGLIQKVCEIIEKSVKVFHSNHKNSTIPSNYNLTKYSLLITL